jgi:hypothetical protein
MANNSRGLFSSLNDEDESSPATRQLYVQAPPSDLVGLSALAGADVLVTLLVLFAAEKWHGSQAWEHQVSDYHYASSSFELLFLLAARVTAVALSANRSRAGLVRVDKDGTVHG